jgi:protein SCO1/2
MPILRRTSVALALVVTLASPSFAHSLQEVEQQLHDKELYFQPVDSQAPNFTLQDADDRIVRRSDFRGKVVVLNFIYTNCPDVCPLQAEKIAQLQAMINPTPMKEQVAFVTVTTDPERDRGQILRDYGLAHGLDGTNWTFLTAAPDQPADSTRALAQAYGLEFTPSGQGLQMHGAVTHVIDQDGQLRARFHGLDFQPVNFVVYVNALVNRAQADHPHDSLGLWDKIRKLF